MAKAEASSSKSTVIFKEDKLLFVAVFHGCINPSSARQGLMNCKTILREKV